MGTQKLQSSMNCQWQRARIVPRQSTDANHPHPRTDRGRDFSANVDRQRIIRVAATARPHGGRSVPHLSSKPLSLMNTFDPAEIRKAVAEFTPLRPQKFQDLIPAKDVIVELRQKGASYRSIADLLTQHCLPTSKTAVAAFCHQVLAENVRPRKRPVRKRPPAAVSSNSGTAVSEFVPTCEPDTPTAPALASNGDESTLTRSRGPRIAQIRKLNPQSNEKTDSHP